jgi:hypothetical protein
MRRDGLAFCGDSRSFPFDKLRARMTIHERCESI